uniref:Uncharacterized protein n=1 Tax=Chelydra serpentina TaxID=8475 RepID=A0A8C3T4D5_CHESE
FQQKAARRPAKPGCHRLSCPCVCEALPFLGSKRFSAMGQAERLGERNGVLREVAAVCGGDDLDTLSAICSRHLRSRDGL